MNKKILEESLARSFSIDQERGINEEKRTVEVAFSSEQAVERWFGMEVLDHDPSSVRLGRLKNGGAVLMDHNRSDQVGVVESVHIDSDRKGRALLRFGKSKRAEEVFNDVRDGIRKNISVGYSVFKYETEKGENGAPDTLRFTDWEPNEISIVSVHADTNCGVGRSAYEQNLNLKDERIMTDKIKKVEEKAVEVKAEETRAAAPVSATPTINVEEIRNQERSRVAAITEAASSAPWDISALSREAIDKDFTVEQFRAKAFEFAASQPAPKADHTGAEMLQRENKNYSLIRAISAQLSNNWDDAGFEREMSQELARQHSVIGGGLMVPMSVLSSVRSNTTDGAGLIGTTHMADQFIDTLQAETQLGKLGARFISGLNGNLTMPKKTANSSFSFLAEGGNATPSNVTVGNISLSGKHLGGQVPMTFEMLRQSNPAIENIVRGDMLEQIALTIDAAGFSGTGTSNQPLGILNTAGVQTVTLADTGGKIPTFAEIVAMEGLLDEADALTGALSYLFRPAIASALKTAKKDAGSGEFVISGGMANGYAAASSTQVPALTSLFGNFNEVIVGSWGVIEIIPERNTLTGGLDIGVHHMMDIAVRRAQSFVKGV